MKNPNKRLAEKAKAKRLAKYNQKKQLQSPSTYSSAQIITVQKTIEPTTDLMAPREIDAILAEWRPTRAAKYSPAWTGQLETEELRNFKFVISLDRANRLIRVGVISAGHLHADIPLPPYSTVISAGHVLVSRVNVDELMIHGYSYGYEIAHHEYAISMLIDYFKDRANRFNLDRTPITGFNPS